MCIPSNRSPLLSFLDLIFHPSSGCSPVRTCTTWRETWIAHVRNLIAFLNALKHATLNVLRCFSFSLDSGQLCEEPVDANDPSTQYLSMLEGSFVWETRTMYLATVGVPMFMLYPHICLHFTRRQIKYKNPHGIAISNDNLDLTPC